MLTRMGRAPCGTTELLGPRVTVEAMRSAPPGTRRTACFAAIALVVLSGCSSLPLGGITSSPTASTTPSEAPGEPITARVMSPSNNPLRLRSKPSTSAKVLATIKRGTTVTLTCAATGSRVRGPEGDSTTWHKVTHSGKTGFLSAAYLRGGDNPLVPRCSDGSATTPAVTRGPELDAHVIEIARGQTKIEATKGNCSPYGQCGPWDGLFATWVWRKAGISIPKYPYSDDMYNWGSRYGRSHLGLNGVGPGDLVLSGTGPTERKTSKRADIVVEVQDDHLRVIGGDIKGRVVERDVKRSEFYGWVDA